MGKISGSHFLRPNRHSSRGRKRSLRSHLSSPKGEPSSAIRERVLKARQIQHERYKNIKGIYCNAQMTTSLLQEYVQLDDAALNLLRTAMKKINLSARAYDRILKVSRTIADLEGSERVETHYIAEAIGYRNLDRDNWFE